MTTVISIALYFLAAFTALVTGAAAHKEKDGATRFGLGLFAFIFIAAACLQVAS